MLYDKYLQRRVVWFLFISLAGAILVSFSIETGWGNTTATERQQIALFAILVPLPSIALLVWDYLRRRAGQSHHISLRDLFTGLLIFATIAVLLRHWQSARREEALALDISLVGDQPHVVVKRVHRSFNPRVLPELRTLTHLTVESREIDESWIEALSELSYLQQLELIDCRIAPGGLAALQRHFALEYLSLERCLIDDEALQFLTRLDTLQRLNLRGTQVTGDCVDQLLEFPRLQELDLRDTLCSQGAVAFNVAPASRYALVGQHDHRRIAGLATGVATS
ncbi:MAG: hypothetical protein R3E01_24005 [Pirellulaceae bacterium]